jgi:hypothetical protein
MILDMLDVCHVRCDIEAVIYISQTFISLTCSVFSYPHCTTTTICIRSIYSATDFNGNRPRAIASLNIAFLFRAVSRPDKGRVEVEGLQNMMGAMKLALQAKQPRVAVGSPPTFTSMREQSSPPASQHANVVLVSSAPDAFDDFETPFGSFHGIKRRGEEIVTRDFPSLGHVVLQMARYDEGFVGEGLDVIQEDSAKNDAEAVKDATKAKRRINRRDAAKAAVDALVDDSLRNKVVQVWTAVR